MFWILNFIFSFLASTFFCVIFDAPRKLYLSCGFVGTCGWMVYILFFNGLNVHTIYSSFWQFSIRIVKSLYGSETKRTCHHFYGNWNHSISTRWFSIRCYKNLVLLNFSTAINTMLEVTLIAGAIALGLLFADQISKLIVSGFVKSFKRL